MAAGWLNNRDTIIAKAQPLLEPGEIVAHVVRAMEGINRWLGVAIAFVVAFPLDGPAAGAVPGAFALFILLFTSLYPRRIILATDQALVVVKARPMALHAAPGARPPRHRDAGSARCKGFWRYTVLERSAALHRARRTVRRGRTAGRRRRRRSALDGSRRATQPSRGW